MKHGCLEDHHKWRVAKAVQLGRRVRMADDVQEPNELFLDDTLPRPPGNPRPSKSKKSDSTHSREAFKEMVQKELRQERANKLGYIEIQKKFEELKFLNFNTDGMSLEDATGIEIFKNDIRARHFGSGSNYCLSYHSFYYLLYRSF
ncbi:hypothetical protein CTI12_AA068560 [Artemisia annua]|uniref:Uncharacterized protein n=1 Tax=Artemisia annua TaxID=35608 RepID=A0A2U1Q6L0_ARTAN|nr:hypothetical protein CTI12_AA068560 [Artemisia annua]